MPINIFGDVMPGRQVAKRISGGVDILARMDRYLEGESLFNICNLETPLLVDSIRNPGKFYATKDVFSIMTRFHGVTLANNHIFDQDLEGLLETIGLLEEFGIQHTGAGKTKTEAFRPILVEENETAVAFLGVTSKENIVKSEHRFLSHIALVEDEEMIEGFVREYKHTAGFLVALPHMGVEHVDCPPDTIRKAYYTLIDRGFDMVVASHPHAVQGIEYYEGKLICYSLGDFIFDSLSILRKDSMVLRLDFSLEGYPKVHLIGTRKNNRLQPTILGDKRTKRKLRRLDRYLKKRYMYWLRLVICKTYNQAYLICDAFKGHGWKGVVNVVRQKFRLLKKR